MKKLFVMAFAVVLLAQVPAFAQVAPAPRSSPRTPVDRSALPGHKPLPPNSVMQGQASILDTEKLRIDDVDMRLFGIVPPQLSASFGPQARNVLDNLVTGQNVSCTIRDRDQSGRYLATCRTSANSDLALELLRRGLAVTARGSLASTDLSAPYIAAEQSAQQQKVGLWSVVTPAAANLVPTKTETVKAEPPKSDPIQALISAAEVKPAKPETAKAADEVQAKAPSASVPASALTPPAADNSLPDTEPGFLARYQLLVTGFIMLLTALGILLVITRQRAQEKRDEMKAIAAALRGELMAARAVCQARIKTIENDADDKAMTWPRIRSTLYQAYVGRLGFLGAELARQIASIYGQASDYSAYYNNDDETRTETAPKKQALQTLVKHIEEVLPRLAVIEQTGRVSFVARHFAPATYEAPVTLTEKAASAEETAPVQSAPSAPLWDTVRKFRERFVDPVHHEDSVEADYASLIEEEMAGMSFTEGEDNANAVQMPENVTKMRTGS